MSGYYCRDCNAVKPLFNVSQGRPALQIPCLGTVPFDPELARHCDQGVPFTELPDTPVGRALDHVAQQLLDTLESRSHSDEVSLRTLR
jgi:MinD-like ATPase involved in chromosome partitioning or flagellar assembly